jgi:hypothetical protein
MRNRLGSTGDRFEVGATSLTRSGAEQRARTTIVAPGPQRRTAHPVRSRAASTPAVGQLGPRCEAAIGSTSNVSRRDYDDGAKSPNSWYETSMAPSRSKTETSAGATTGRDSKKRTAPLSTVSSIRMSLTNVSRTE